VGVIERAARLENKRDYRGARALLEPALERDRDDLKIRTRLARATYKDRDLHVVRRLDGALQILTGTVGGRPLQLQDQESLGIAGAIFKLKWEVYGHESYLHRSLALYRRAAEQGVAGDDAYTAINVAFVLDLLADLEASNDPDSPHPEERRREANEWREQVVECLEPQLENGKGRWWWPLVTMIEALVGLGREGEARRWVEQAARLRAHPDPDKGPHPWEIESTARQIAAIVRLRQTKPDPEAFAESDPAELLRELLGPKCAAGVETAWTGKVGLALSGGGFRASLYHVGVLARLAELDVLRRVEVLSCVSGGSILGAYYYLKVRELLEANDDDHLGREDYLKLVQELEREFLAAIECNVRVRLLTNPWRVLQMAVLRGYTRTDRAGQLFQKRIYAQLGNLDWRMPHVRIWPPDEDKDEFKPAHDNWRRSNKVPILVINATTMNTGHNWQFTATWMGEPPSAIDDDVDVADRLRRLYYREAPSDDHRSPPLGRAVGASAAVPGLFPPVSLKKLYPDLTVRLSDGGVHDNQGIASLVDQDCSVILVSDASGQGESLLEPNDRALPALSRTLSVAMGRVRQAQYLDLAARRAASSLRGLMFVHLKKDLPHVDVTWEDGQDAPGQKPADQRDTGSTPYGVRRDVQRRLASIRTDLDAFHEQEAYALMASGYRMVDHYFGRGNEGFPITSGTHPWRFCGLQSAVQGREGHAGLLGALRRSDKLFFKWFPSPKWMTRLVAALVVVLFAAAVLGAQALGGWTAVLILLGVVLVGGVLLAIPDDGPLVYSVSLLAKIPAGLVCAIVAPPIAWAYLWTLNRLYLNGGRAPPGARPWSPSDQDPEPASTTPAPAVAGR
jgi:predicted acylesterase/phospholipase RssA